MEIVVSCFDVIDEADRVRLSFLIAGHAAFEDACVVVRTSIGKLRWLRWTRTMAEVHPANYPASSAIIDTILQNQKIIPYNHAADGYDGDILDMRRDVVFEQTSMMGVDDQFLRKLATRLQPGCSALFFILETAETDALTEILRPVSNEIFRTSISYDKEQLRQVLLQKQKAMIHQLMMNLQNKLLEFKAEAEGKPDSERAKMNSLEASLRDPFASGMLPTLPDVEKRSELVIGCFSTMYKAEEFRLSPPTTESEEFYEIFKNAFVVIRSLTGKLKYMEWTRPWLENFPCDETPLAMRLLPIILENPVINTAYPHSDDEQVMSAGLVMRRAIVAEAAVLSGINQTFLQGLTSKLQPGCSALFLTLEPGTADFVEELLRNAGSTVMRTSVIYDRREYEAVEKAHAEIFIVNRPDDNSYGYYMP